LKHRSATVGGLRKGKVCPGAGSPVKKIKKISPHDISEEEKISRRGGKKAQGLAYEGKKVTKETRQQESKDGLDI